MDATVAHPVDRSTSALDIEDVVALTATIEDANVVETHDILEVERPMNPKIARIVDNAGDTQDILEVEMPMNQEIVVTQGVRHCVHGYVTRKNGKRVWHVGIWEGCGGRPFNHDETMKHKKNSSSGADLE